MVNLLPDKKGLKKGEGGIQKGQVRNPTGIGGPIPPPVRELAKTYTKEAIDRLVYWMREKDFPTVSLRAAEILLERAWGKPEQPITADDKFVTALSRMNEEAARIAAQPLPPGEGYGDECQPSMRRTSLN